MKPNIPPKFQTEPLSETKQNHLSISFEECKDLTERDIKCPYCGHSLHGVFSDISGHLRVKCNRCKANMVLNVAYFRRQRGYGKRKEYILRRYGE